MSKFFATLFKSVEFYCLLIIFSLMTYVIIHQNKAKQNVAEYWEAKGIVIGEDAFVRPHMEQVTVIDVKENSIHIRHVNGSTYRDEWILGQMLVPDLENK